MTLGHFTYLPSDSQKWNVRRLMCFLPLVILPEGEPGSGQQTQWSPSTPRSEAMEEWASHKCQLPPKLQAEELEDRDVPLPMLEEPEVEMPRLTQVQVPEEPERWSVLQRLVPVLDQTILLRIENRGHQWDDPVLFQEQLEFCRGELQPIVHYNRLRAAVSCKQLLQQTDDH